MQVPSLPFFCHLTVTKLCKRQKYILLGWTVRSGLNRICLGDFTWPNHFLIQWCFHRFFLLKALSQMVLQRFTSCFFPQFNRLQYCCSFLITKWSSLALAVWINFLWRVNFFFLLNSELSDIVVKQLPVVIKNKVFSTPFWHLSQSLQSNMETRLGWKKKKKKTGKNGKNGTQHG